MGRPKESKTKTVSNKQLAKYSAFSHGLCIQLLVENMGEGYFLGHLACRNREKMGTCLALNLIFDKRTGNYHRTSLGALREVTIDGYFSYKVTLADVYMAQPRLDFALSLRPVRYQMESSSSISNPEAVLYLMEDTVGKSGFSLVTYLPQVTHLEQSRSNLPNLEPPGLPLWSHDRDSAVIYKNQKTGESFAVLIATSQKHLFRPQGFLVYILDDINPDTFGAEAVEEFFKHNSQSLTDLSTQMLVKFLRSGKQVILSVNTLSEGSLQIFKLWVVVTEPKM
jgi:hypothetical protein